MFNLPKHELAGPGRPEPRLPSCRATEGETSSAETLRNPMPRAVVGAQHHVDSRTAGRDRELDPIAGLQRDTCYLLRPDSYIAMASIDPNELQTYFARLKA